MTGNLRCVPGVRLLTCPAACLVVAAAMAAGDEPKDPAKPPVAIVPVQVWGNVFGGRETGFKFRVEATRPVKGRVVWRFAVGTATAAAREVDLAATPDAARDIALTLPVPPVKDGVAFAGRLSVSVVEAGEKKAVAAYDRDIWVFPQDPFANRTEWLKKLQLHLYDPVGATAKAFTAAKIPFAEIGGLAALAAVKDGVVVIGEGASFKEDKDLSAILDVLAGAGVTVLCLAPADGELVIPGLGKPSAKQQELTFTRDIVRKLDKRLDADGWPPNGQAMASAVAVKARDGLAVGEVTPPGGGWPWVEARYASGKGRWAVCGLAVVARWNDGPTPRFLLARMLEHLSAPEADSPKAEGKL